MRPATVDCVLPPVPSNRFDFRATWVDYEPGDPIGWGATPDAALRDLHEKEARLEAVPC